MRKDWDETGCGMHVSDPTPSRRSHNYAFRRFPLDSTLVGPLEKTQTNSSLTCIRVCGTRTFFSEYQMMGRSLDGQEI